MALLTFTDASESDPRIEEWFADHQTDVGRLASHWFRIVRGVGDDVAELLHDGLLTVCLADHPFAYVGGFKAHASVGFFYGAELADPEGLLEGFGKLMRHVKVRPTGFTQAEALEQLVKRAYADIQHRLEPL